MDEREVEKLEEQLYKKAGLDPTASLPPGDPADTEEYRRRSGPLKLRIEEARRRNEPSIVAQLEVQLNLLRCIARARGIQRQLNKIDSTPVVLTPWPEQPK